MVHGGTGGDSLAKVKDYVEGVGDGRDLRARRRMGFSSFFEKANLAGRMPRVIACGGWHNAFEEFCPALVSGAEREFVVLLVDSEGPVADDAEPWVLLAERDGWVRPHGATNENAHLMVHCIEAWFQADKDSLAEHFGRNFDRNALRGRRETEEVAKENVPQGLRHATRKCAKGSYGKGRHSFDVLARIDPANVRDASPHAKGPIDISGETAT